MDQVSRTNDWEGTGEEDSPFLLKTEADLRLLYQRVMRDSEPFVNKFFRLTQDVAMSQKEWKAIGSSGKQFQGKLDGGFHLISGLRIKPTDYTGFFGYIGSSGAVSNLGVTGDISGAAFGTTCGGIVGTNNGRVSACLSQMNIVLQEGASKKICAVGTVVGVNAQRAVLRDCVAKGTISAKKTAGAAAYTYYLGGIAGQNSAETGVLGCVAEVEINTTDAWEQISAVGGVVGYSKQAKQAAVQCCSLGAVKGAVKAGFAAVVGQGEGVSGCYALEAVSKTARDGTIVAPARLLEASFVTELNHGGDAVYMGQTVCGFGQTHPIRPLPSAFLGEACPVSFRQLCLLEREFPLGPMQGKGTQEEPFVLTSRAELFHGACHPDFHVRLNQDLTIGGAPAYQPPKEFRATFDGNGKRLDFSAQAPDGTGFVQNLRGSLHNLTLRYQAPAKEQSFSGLAEENNGTISGCTVEGVLEGGPDLCGLVRRNKGTLTGCTCKGNLTLRSSGSEGGVYATVGEDGTAATAVFQGTIQVDVTGSARIRIHPGESCAASIHVNHTAKGGRITMSATNIRIYDYCPLVIEAGEKVAFQRMFFYPGGYVWIKGDATLEVSEVVKCTQAQLEQLDPALLYRDGTPAPPRVNEEKAEFYIGGEPVSDPSQEGENGQDGKNGGMGLNGGCGGHGGDGFHGAPGAPGAPGPNATIEIKNLKSPITVVTAGGDGQAGGDGGAGGAGGDGGDGAELGGDGGDGGRGGNGGCGGDGGDGGLVEVFYFSENGSTVATQTPTSIGGAVGRRGLGGDGGSGGRSLEVGDMDGRSGRQGHFGKKAAPGGDGKPGVIRLYKLPDPRDA